MVYYSKYRKQKPTIKEYAVEGTGVFTFMLMWYLVTILVFSL